MNTFERLTIGLIAAVSWATALEMRPLFDLDCDLWRLPAILRHLEAMCQQRGELDEKQALLRSFYAARLEVVDRLRARQLTTPQAIDRFCDLAALRASHHFAKPIQCTDVAPRLAACSDLRAWLQQERTLRPGAPGNSALIRAEQELDDYTHGMKTMPEMH